MVKSLLEAPSPSLGHLTQKRGPELLPRGVAPSVGCRLKPPLLRRGDPRDRRRRGSEVLTPEQEEKERALCLHLSALRHPPPRQSSSECWFPPAWLSAPSFQPAPGTSSTLQSPPRVPRTLLLPSTPSPHLPSTGLQVCVPMPPS